MKHKQYLYLLITLAFICSTVLCTYIYGTLRTSSQNNNNSRFEEKTEALDALDFESAMRAYPNAQAPEGSFTQAYKQYCQHFATQTL